MKTAQQVYDFLVAYMNKFQEAYPAWYAGIGADPKARLFTDHAVQETGGRWAFDLCDSESDARAVEEALLKLGCKGGGGGGNNTTRSCYVYYITNSTIEDS